MAIRISLLISVKNILGVIYTSLGKSNLVVLKAGAFFCR